MNPEPATSPAPQLIPSAFRPIIIKTGLKPDEFLDLCLREQLHEIHLTEFGPTPGHNALWNVKYYELPKEDDGK